jgi:hypothetical protein
MLAPEDLAAGLQRLYTPTRGKAFRGDDGWWALAVLGLLLFLADLVLRSAPLRVRAAPADG